MRRSHHSGLRGALAHEPTSLACPGERTPASLAPPANAEWSRLGEVVPWSLRPRLTASTTRARLAASRPVTE